MIGGNMKKLHIAGIALCITMLGACALREPVNQAEIDAWNERLQTVEAWLDDREADLDSAEAAVEQARQEATRARELAEQIAGAQGAELVRQADAAVARAVSYAEPLRQEVRRARELAEQTRAQVETIKPGTPRWMAWVQGVGGTILTLLGARYIPGSERVAMRVMGRPRERRRYVEDGVRAAVDEIHLRKKRQRDAGMLERAADHIDEIETDRIAESGL
jgi:outer membrane murein-binding lipoprotein Lpp